RAIPARVFDSCGDARLRPLADVNEKPLGELIGESVGAALARRQKSRKRLAPGLIEIVKIGKIEALQGFEQRTRVVERRKAEPGFGPLQLPAQRGELIANRMGIGFILQQQVEQRQKLGLTLVAR